jgi:hypothetical protein
MLELGQPVVLHSIDRRRLLARSVTAQQVRVALLLLPWASRQARDEFALDQAVEHALDVVEAGEGVQPGRSLLQLAGRLRPAQHQHAEHGDLFLRHAERLVEQVPELDRSAGRSAREPRPSPARESVQRGADRRLVVLHDGLAVGRLVAGQAE